MRKSIVSVVSIGLATLATPLSAQVCEVPHGENTILSAACTNGAAKCRSTRQGASCSINGKAGKVVAITTAIFQTGDRSRMAEKTGVLSGISVSNPLACGFSQTKHSFSLAPTLIQSVFPYWQFEASGAMLRPERVVSGRLHWNVRPMDNLAVGSSINFSIGYGNLGYISFAAIGSLGNYQSLGLAPWNPQAHPTFQDVVVDLDAPQIDYLNQSRSAVPSQGPVTIVSQLSSQSPQNRNVVRSATLETCHFTGANVTIGDLPLRERRRPRPGVPAANTDKGD